VTSTCWNDFWYWHRFAHWDRIDTGFTPLRESHKLDRATPSKIAPIDKSLSYTIHDLPAFPCWNAAWESYNKDHTQVIFDPKKLPLWSHVGAVGPSSRWWPRGGGDLIMIHQPRRVITRPPISPPASVPWFHLCLFTSDFSSPARVSCFPQDHNFHPAKILLLSSSTSSPFLFLFLLALSWLISSIPPWLPLHHCPRSNWIQR
jgi:hypothetical protein